jgi:hypothetical protein
VLDNRKPYERKLIFNTTEVGLLNVMNMNEVMQFMHEDNGLCLVRILPFIAITENKAHVF